jgi:predicted DNA-binding protein
MASRLSNHFIRPSQHIRRNRPADLLGGRQIEFGQLQVVALQCNAKADNYMERQLTMRLPAELATKLERSAKRLKRKKSEVVREALEQYLDTQPEVRPIERVRDLLGSVASGRPDLGQRHRDYLTRRLRRGR